MSEEIKMFWVCPECNEKVDFLEQMQYLFDENGEAEFDAELGVFFHTIICEKCNSCWTISISEKSKMVLAKDLKVEES